jgi:hypothetical protein
MRWAMINENNIVDNIIVWDGQGELFSGKTIVQLQDEEWCNIGALYDATGTPRFTAVEEPEDPAVVEG